MPDCELWIQRSQSARMVHVRIMLPSQLRRRIASRFCKGKRLAETKSTLRASIQSTIGAISAAGYVPSPSSVAMMSPRASGRPA